MAGFLDKIGKAASEAASIAGNKAGELIEVGKLKNRISSQKQDAGLAMKEIGEYYYGLYLEGQVTDERVISLCDRIKACNDEIANLEKQIQLARDEYDAKAGRTAAE